MTELNTSTFDEKKASEVAFFFLSRAASFEMHISKLRLVKWMYLAERLSYQKYGEPLMGDRLCSMKHGPAVLATLSLMENRARVGHTGAWDSVVSLELDDDQSQHSYAVLAEECPYRSENDLLTLSDSELDLLSEVWRDYGRMNTNELEKFLHDARTCPEWQWRGMRARDPIELEGILNVLGYDSEQTSSLIARIKAAQEIGQVFAN